MRINVDWADEPENKFEQRLEMEKEIERRENAN